MTTVCRLKVYTDAGYIICFHGDKYTTVVNSKRREQKKTKTKRQNEKLMQSKLNDKEKRPLHNLLSVSQQKGGDIPLAKGLVWVWFHTS